MRIIKGLVHTVIAPKAELHDVLTQPGERDAARLELERAESRGFLFCEAVFVDGTFDGLFEKAHPTNGRLDWGRGQDVTKRNFFRDGQLVRDPDYPEPAPEHAWCAHGLDCRVYLTRLGHRCGYVRVPEGHRYFGREHDACLVGEDCVTAALRASDPDGYHSCYEHSIEHDVHVHGGVTFAAAIDGEGADWWIGFDCAHAGDAPSPEYLAEARRRYGSRSHDSGHYWTLPEVIAETERLAAQISGDVPLAAPAEEE